MWQCSAVLSISERNLFNDRSSVVCKKYTSLKLRALYTVCRRREAIFICFLVKGAMKYGCSAHVVKIIQKYFYSSITGPTLLKVRIFSYIDRIVSVFFHIWTDSPILSKYKKIRIWFCPHTGKYGCEVALILVFFMHCFSVLSFYNGLIWKYNPLRDIEKFHQPLDITPLQLGIRIESIIR